MPAASGQRHAAPARQRSATKPAAAPARAWRSAPPADWLGRLARCSVEDQRACASAVGNRRMAMVAAQAKLARAPISEPKPHPRVAGFAQRVIDELEDEPNMRIVVSNLLAAMKLGEIHNFVAILKNTRHDFYGDCFIAMASEINERHSSKSTVVLFKLMADRGVDIVGQLGTYSLDPLAKVAAFKSLVEEFREMVEYGDISKADADSVRSLISDAEYTLRSIEGTWTKPAQPRIMSAAAAAWTAVAVLAANDVTGIGIADDVLIPFAVVGAAALSIGAAFSGPKPQILDYAPAVATVTAAVRQMTDLVRLNKAIQTAKGNVADTGVMQAANALIAAAAGLTLCQALQLLLDQASRARNTDQMRKIRATQKAKGCRHSRTG